MVTKVQKWGNSQGLRLPKTILDEAKINIEDSVQVTVEKGQIIIKPLTKVRGKYNLESLILQMPETYEAEEFDWGSSCAVTHKEML